MRKTYVVTLTVRGHRQATGTVSGPALPLPTTWFHASRDVAIARVTAFFVAYPTASLREATLEALDAEGVMKSETIFTMEVES
jgi:hypothetical protein